MSLPMRLRQATQAVHAQAERSGVMRALLHGALPRPAYLRLLNNLHAIYLAMESALARHASHPWVSAVYDARLARAPALRADLALLAPNSQAQPLALATISYVERLRGLGQDDPPALIAHAYTRYLGDLSGGQLLGPRVARMLGLAEDGAGTAFYRFDDPGQLSQRFRAGLATLPEDAAMQDRIVAEACWAFAQHIELFNELKDAGSSTITAS